MTNTEALQALVREEIKPMVDAFVADSLRDPDMVAKSVDFKRGYEQGVRESFVAALSLVMRRR